MFKKKSVFILIVTPIFFLQMVNCNLFAQNNPPKVLWWKTFGSVGYDAAFSVEETNDSNYIVAGECSSGSRKDDPCVIKIDKLGNKIWSRVYGGNDYDWFYSVEKTIDEGYIAGGWTTSFGAGNRDFYLIKLNENGDEIWGKTYGGDKYDVAYSISQTNDGGYIVAGGTKSFGAGKGDVYVIKLDKEGNVIWNKTFGGKNLDWVYSIKQTSDKGYIFVGWTFSFGAGGRDFYIVKIDADGNKIWEKTFGGSSYDCAYSVQQINDSGYIVAGVTKSFGAGDGDVYLIKLDNSGNKIWEKIFGGSAYDSVYAIQQTKDGGYIAAGATKSYGTGDGDAYVIKLNADGNKIWEKTFGGKKLDIANDIKQTSDGGYIIAGETYSYGKGNNDIYLVKLDKENTKE